MVMLVEAPQAIDRLRSWFPPVAPMVVGWSKSELRPNGLWRVTHELTIRERCGIAVWRRWFRASGAEDIELPAVDSNGVVLSPISLGIRTEPGTYVDWWDYDPIPGLRGVRVTTVTFAQCPSGFTGVVTLYVEPFDWTAVKPPPSVSGGCAACSGSEH